MIRCYAREVTSGPRRVLFLAAAVSVATVGACASFRSTSDPGEADSGIDASDVTSNADGGTDGSLCASPHALCDDFNRAGSPLDPARWGAALGDAGVLDTPSFATSPALVVDVGPTGSGSYRLQKTIPGPFQSVHCSFRVYIKDTGTISSGIPFSVALMGTVGYSAYFSLRPKNDSRPADVLESAPAPGEREVEFFTIGTGAWSTVELEAPVLRLWLNGVEKHVDPADGGPISGPFASAIIELGLSLYAPPDVGWGAALDDIVCDIR